MDDKISDLLDKIMTLESDLGRALSGRAEQIKRDLNNGRVQFEAELIRRHKDLRKGVIEYLRTAHVLSVITAPVIYSLIVPLILLDVFLFLFQTVCFRAYGITKVQRHDYIVFDRVYLAYLNPIEKMNCAYCSYANGLIAYAREIAGRTEAYWCPIKHARRYLGPHPYYKEFSDYGDAEAYRNHTAKTGH